MIFIGLSLGTCLQFFSQVYWPFVFLFLALSVIAFLPTFLLTGLPFSYCKKSDILGLLFFVLFPRNILPQVLIYLCIDLWCFSSVFKYMQRTYS